MSTNSAEIQALVTLIEDPDERIYDHIRSRILTLGELLVPVLEQAWEDEGRDDLFRNRIEDLLHTMRVDATCARLKAWHDSGAEDLLEGALAVCCYRYAEFDERQVRARLAAIRQDIWLELNDNLTAFEKVRVFNQIFFEAHGFKADQRNIHAAQNNYINVVLERHKGNPLSLAMIYQLVAQELDLPLFGVNLPNHFILAYLDETGVAASGLGYVGVLFYVNPYSQGDILGKSEIDAFLEKLDVEPKAQFYQPCTPLETIRRMLMNLLANYIRVNDNDRVADIRKLLEVL